jgi:hypothetical protein
MKDANENQLLKIGNEECRVSFFNDSLVFKSRSFWTATTLSMGMWVGMI